jgi:hypothetical protein
MALLVSVFAFLEYEIHVLPQPNFAALQISSPTAESESPLTTASLIPRYRDGLLVNRPTPPSTTPGMAPTNTRQTIPIPIITAPSVMAREGALADANNPDPRPPESSYFKPGDTYMDGYCGWETPQWIGSCAYGIPYQDYGGKHLKSNYYCFCFC